jgi:hypothetical protein
MVVNLERPSAPRPASRGMFGSLVAAARPGTGRSGPAGSAGGALSSAVRLPPPAATLLDDDDEDGVLEHFDVPGQRQVDTLDLGAFDASQDAARGSRSELSGKGDEGSEDAFFDDDDDF